MSADGSHDEVRSCTDRHRAAKAELSLILEDVEESCLDIDKQCRAIVRDVLDSIESVPAPEEDGNAADFLRRLSKIWSQAHNIRRAVERDEPDGSPHGTDNPEAARESAVSS